MLWNLNLQIHQNLQVRMWRQRTFMWKYHMSCPVVLNGLILRLFIKSKKNLYLSTFVGSFLQRLHRLMLSQEILWLNFIGKILCNIWLERPAEDIYLAMHVQFFEFMRFWRLGDWSTLMLIHMQSLIDWVLIKNQ